MKRVISLKEFSTTPTVSCMLRKDGNNVSDNADGDAPSSGNNAHANNNSSAVDGKVHQHEAPKAAPKQEEMFEME